MLQHLVDEERVRSIPIAIHEETREDFTAFETTTGQEFRFVLPGPQLSATEWSDCLQAIATFREPLDFLVVSGSLPPGVPEDFYARILEIARARPVPIVVDASGPAFRAAVAQGLDLLKPSLRELRELTGETLADEAACVGACENLVDSGKTKVVALTLGGQGALLVTRDGAWRASPVAVEPISAVGAGDSFLGAMVAALASGLSMETSFRHGVAGGTAALLAPGTQLCRAADVSRLLARVIVEPVARGARNEFVGSLDRDVVPLGVR
jgi:6-phosphofructokinase 2